MRPIIRYTSSRSKQNNGYCTYPKAAKLIKKPYYEMMEEILNGNISHEFHEGEYKIHESEILRYVTNNQKRQKK